MVAVAVAVAVAVVVPPGVVAVAPRTWLGPGGSPFLGIIPDLSAHQPLERRKAPAFKLKRRVPPDLELEF